MRRAFIAWLALVSAPAHAADPPRLTGTVFTPGDRVALFESAGTVTPVREGEDVGGYVVGSIKAGEVYLVREGKTLILRPSATNAPAPPVDDGGVTFGLVLRDKAPADD